MGTVDTTAGDPAREGGERPRRTTRSVIEHELTDGQARVLRRRFGVEGARFDDDPDVPSRWPTGGDEGTGGGTPAPASADPPEPRRRRDP